MLRRRPPLHRRPRIASEGGQAAVELVAVLPLVAAILALAWQAVLAGHAAWAVTAAARAAARAAAVGASADHAARGHLADGLERGLRVRRRAAGVVEVSVPVPRVLRVLPLGRVAATGRFRPQDAP
jgi:pilus assembly protein CpaE